MGEYCSTMKIEKWLFDWCQMALSIEDLNELDDDTMRVNDLQFDDNVFLGSCSFKNNRTLNWYIASGNHNYYNDWVMFFEDGGDFGFDPSFDISEGKFDLVYDDEIYTIDIKIV